MDSTRHLILSVILSIVVVLIGTAGYMLIEGWGFLDALYMTVITVSTVGYSEVHEISLIGRIFTIFLVVSGVGFTLFVAGALVQFLVEGRMRTILGRRRLDKNIDRLRGHYIICGYGRIGRVVCQRIVKKPIDVVVIEQDPDLIPVLNADTMLYIPGDAADEDNLVRAGIARAKGLIAALATDVQNVFLILTARQLNPDLNIIARADQEESKKKLMAAGADTVESPYDVGAHSMAQRILSPTVTSFLNLALAHGRTDIQMEEIPVSRKSNLVNVMLKDSNIRQNYNLILIAIKQDDGQMRFNPSFETIIRAGETVIAVGELENLRRLEKVLNPGETTEDTTPGGTSS